MAISYGTYTITEVQEGSQIWTSSVAPSSPNYTFTISNLTGDSETSVKVGDIIMYSYYRYTVLSISSDGTTVLTGNRVSIRGATGAASVTYSLIVSNLAIIKDKDGNLSPSSITVTAKSQTGSNAMANYTGRIKIETTTNNSTWTSRINEDASTKTYTIPTDTVAIRCSLYLNGGTTTLLDQQTIPVVSDGLDGTNVTITSTSITYQEGTSGTEKPTGTWKTDIQSVAQGNFLWTKTVVNYSDGSSTESYSVARQGSNGTNGISPTVSNTVVEYQQSTNGKIVPTGTWNTTPPTAIAEQFMWTRTTITYSDSATAISYSVSRNGTNGTSISISSTSVTYQKGTSGTLKPTGTWETNVQPVGEGEYLWTKTVVTYSDSSKTESYSVSRNAVNGTNGTSPTVTSTVTEYVQSNNGTTAPTSGWNTSPPSTVTAGWFMWTKITVTYSDNATSISYTVSKNGTNGNNGINTATVYLYKKGTTTPSVPSGSTTYTFSTKKLTGTLDSWSQTIPTTGDGECYVTAAVASSSGTTDTIATGEWSTPIQFNGTNGTNGTDGTNGLNQATIFLYKRGASVTKPTTSVTYTFSTGALSAEPNSWKRNIPTIDGNPCWVVTATAIGNETTAIITGSNWSDPVKLVEDGEDGKDAYTIVLTNENHTFAGNTTSAIASEIECNVIAYKGTTQVASTIGTITGQPTGMTTSLLNNGTVNSAFKVTVTTSMVTRNGILNVPITVDGKTFTKKFTYGLALKGSAGTSENLLMDVYASSLTKVDAPWSRYLSDASNSTITGEFIAEDNLPDPNATHFYRITDSSASTHGRALCFYSSGTPPFITEHTYRIGCWVRKHDGSPKIQITLGSYGSWMPTQRKIENTEWEWFEVVHTFGETDASKTTQSDNYKRLYFYFYNNNVAGSSLDMCGFKMEEVQVNSGTARNFILGTEKLVDWTTTQGATISNGVVTFPDVTADTWREACSAKSFKYGLIRNQYVIFSIKVKADSDKKCRFYLNVSVDNDETTHIRQKYFDQYIYFTGDGEWQTVCLAVPVFDYMFNTGSGTVDFDDCWVAIRFGAANNYWNGFQAKEPQLCLGTTATSWSRAPEDVDEAIDNIEIGGRNLMLNTLHPDATGTNLKRPHIIGQIVNTGGRGTCTIAEHGIRFTNTTSNWQYIYFGSSSNTATPSMLGLEAGETYTLSADLSWKILSSDDGKANTTTYYMGAFLAWSPNQSGSWGVVPHNEQFPITQADKGTDMSGKLIYTFTVPKNAVRLYLGIRADNTTAAHYGVGDYIEARNLKLEKGNKATSWTPAPEDIEEEVSNLRTDLQSQIDEKIQTYYQATAPSWSSATDRAKHDGDLWYCTETDLYTGYEAKNIYRYDSVNNTWVGYSATSELFDAVDGKSTIYYGATTGTYEDVEDGDYLVDSTTGSTYRYYNDAWVTVTDYQTAIDNIEIGGRNLLKDSDVTNTSLTTPLCGGTVIQTIPSGTVITLSVQVDADDVVWGSSGNKRIGVASSIVKDSGGNQYIEAWAAMTGRTGTGIDKTFDTSFHGRVKSTYTLQGELPLDKAFNLYVQSVTSGTVSVSRPKLEIGNKATDWTPAPEDIEEEIASKADSSVAVEEEQLIYISKASGTNTVTGTTTWITGTGDVQNTWTTKRPTYNSSYPVLFIAKQKKTVSGTVTCTTPLKDDTTTVIDGGHITTGTIDASQVTVTNIDASEISTGTLKADVIGANSLSISQISGLQSSLNGKQPTGDYATNSGVTTAINNIEIGGRNLIINTLNPDATAANRPKFLEQTVNTTGRGTALVAEHGIRFTTTSASYCYIYMGFTAISNGTGATLQGLTAGKTYTFSCDFTCKLLSADTSTTIRSLRFSLYDDTSGSFALDKYQDMIDLDASKKGTEQLGYFYYTFTLPTNITKFGFMIRTTVTTNNLFQTGDFIELRNIKLEEGNKATKWSPAPEDINTEVNNAEENAKKVATNYLAIDETGIMVADMKDGQQTPSGILSGNNVFINNTSVNIRDGQSTLASFGIEGMQIGLNTETHTEQDYHSWKMIDKDGNIYAFVSDLRDEYGEATITETAKLNEATNWVETNFEISSIISVTVNGGEPESYQKRLPKLIDITPEPTDEDVVVVTYTSQSPELKAYTFGKRIQDSNIGGYSFIEGADNVASGYASHAEGVHTTASGHDSHAEGLGTTASGDYSHAQNFYTTASSSCQTVVGRHNVDDKNNKYAFIVGNGHRNQSINKLDYANALGITWNGTMEIGGLMCGTLIEDSEPTKNPPTRTPIPLFKTVSWSGNSSDSWDNQVIPSNGEWYRYGFNIYQKGYRALGVVGFGAFNATSNPSNVTWCIVTKCYTWYNPNIITDDNHIGADTLDIYVWNQHQSQSAKVKIFVRVLYIAESALVGALEPGTPA